MGGGKKWEGRRDGVKKQKEREAELDNKNIESNMFRARLILLAHGQINSSVIFFIIWQSEITFFFLSFFRIEKLWMYANSCTGWTGSSVWSRTRDRIEADHVITWSERMWNEEKKDGKENKIEINRVDRTNGKGGCMLMERKKIVKWENGELHSMRYVGGRNELGGDSIIGSRASRIFSRWIPF